MSSILSNIRLLVNYFLTKNGAGSRSRTRDILITREELYQLSYTGKINRITRRSRGLFGSKVVNPEAYAARAKLSFAVTLFCLINGHRLPDSHVSYLTLSKPVIPIRNTLERMLLVEKSGIEPESSEHSLTQFTIILLKFYLYPYLSGYT